MPIWERTLPRLVGRVPIVGVACDDRNIVVRDTGCLKVANRLFLGPVVAAGWLVETACPAQRPEALQGVSSARSRRPV